MLFSKYFKITPSEEDDWFDPVLFSDTRLFIDPFLIYDLPHPFFEGSHDELIQFFSHIFELVAKSIADSKSLNWGRAISLLELGEVDELRLGYAGAGEPGAGSGPGLALAMARGIRAAIKRGVTALEHFEEVQIFQENIGPDRISDATANILRHKIAKYTESVCRRHNIPVVKRRVLKARFNPAEARWQADSFELPTNPYTSKPVLLIPKDFLRPLPTINAEDFWEYCWDGYSDDLRARFGDDISKRVNKKTIIQFAAERPDLREYYVHAKEIEGGEPYDLRTDPEGYYQPYIQGFGWAEKNSPKKQLASGADLLDAILELCALFKSYVEDNEGWRLLWNDDGSAKKEIAFQALLSGLAICFCMYKNIDLSKEPNIGRGPVDFKFSVGYMKRVLLEAKLAKNSRFWNGLTKQLPTYMRAERVDFGIFLVSCQREQDWKKISGIRQAAKEVSSEIGKDIRVIAVDTAFDPESASKL